MARILICHVPKDGNLARDLGAALMGRGHFVSFDGEPDSPRPERAARLRQFEAVIVVWTEASAQSAGLANIAREALPLNLLVPVRAEDLSPTRLPLALRKLNMPSPRDVDGIARVIARMSTAASSRRDMAALSLRDGATSSLRDGAEREAARRTADGVPAPDAPRTAVRGSPPPSPQPAAALPAAAGASRWPSSAAWPGPVAAPGTGVRVRPLVDLPEVEAPPAPGVQPQPPAARHQDAAGDVARSPAHAHPAEPPPRAPARTLTADDLARAVEAGLLVHRIPPAMWLGAPTTVEITLGRDVLASLFPAKDSQGGLGQSLETLSVSLYGSAEAFEIERQSERTQFVTAKHALASHDPATFGRWAWLVTPCAAGPHDLVIRISALLRDGHGVPAPVALPDRRLSVEIQVPEEESFLAALAGWQRR